jgi:glucokinase
MTRDGGRAAACVALAIDVGGTNIRVGLVRDDGKLLTIERAETPRGGSPGEVMPIIQTLTKRVLSSRQGDLAGTGVSIAAFVTPRGVVTATAHLSTSWIGVDLHRELRGLPVPRVYGLDSPAPALGEAYFGAGQGVTDLVYVTLSTGIGAAVVWQGRHWGGGAGWAGGIGHTIVDETSDRTCSGCGNRGCLETFAARQGIEATARELMAADPGGMLDQLTKGDPDRLTSQLVAEAAHTGDGGAREVFRRAGHALGIGLTNLIDVLAPSLVVVGGGISGAGELILDPARAVVRARAFPPALRDVPILPAALGDLSGVYGAAAMVLQDVRVECPPRRAT